MPSASTSGLSHACIACVVLFGLAVPRARAYWKIEKPPGLAEAAPPLVFGCPVERWHHDIVKEQGRAILAPVCGDLRGDGRERMYAQLAGGPLVELELRPDGPRTSGVLVAKEHLTGFPGGVRTSLAKRSGSALPSLFVADLFWLAELSWNGKGWDVQSIRQRSGGFIWAIAAGDGRGDGLTRLYTASTMSVDEYSQTPVGWRREEFSPGVGAIRGLRFVALPGEPRPALALDSEQGVHVMRWQEEGKVAVLDFAGHGRSAREAAGFSDLLRARLFQIGNCRLVERTEIDAVLREQALGASAPADPAGAARAGALMGADWVVIGSLGRAEGREFADVRIVSPKTGAAARSEYAAWTGKAEMEKSIELLAQAACPDTSRRR